MLCLGKVHCVSSSSSFGRLYVGHGTEKLAVILLVVLNLTVSRSSKAHMHPNDLGRAKGFTGKKLKIWDVKIWDFLDNFRVELSNLDF